MPGAVQSGSNGQVICWDRGRHARNEREARKRIVLLRENLRACGALRAGRPRTKQIT